MLPVVIRTTEEMLRLVPAEQREASMALGSRKARTIMRVVLPAAHPGIVSGALLAVARAAGETAPLLFVIGFTFTTNTKLFSGGNTALSVQIYRQRHIGLRGRPGPGLGRRAHPHRAGVRVHHRGPHRDGAVRQKAGMRWAPPTPEPLP